MSGEKPEFDGSRLDQAKREASLWVVKQAYGFSAEEQDAFFDWLAESPEHAELHANCRSAWRHLDVLADWRPEHSLKPNPDLLDTTGPAKKRSTLKNISVLGGLAAIVVLAFLGASYFEKASPARLAKGVFAETHERHVLEDGSIVKLNKGAQALISFSEKSRYVILERGEANFNIAKDNKRPFIVVANHVAVQAVGTMFNVLINEGLVDVMVTEGRVILGEKSAKDPVLKAKAIGQTVQELRAGQRSVIDVRQKNSLPVVEPISKVEIDKQLTWLKLFDFTATPLSEIVLEFNQRNEQKMVIDDPSIEDLAVSASIQSNNIDVFVSVLELTMNIEAEKIDDSTILLRSKSTEFK